MTNNILKQAMLNIRLQKPNLDASEKVISRFECVNGALFCDLWFYGKGCTMADKGYCTMCDYGKGCEVDSQELINEMKIVLSIEGAVDELLISPSGSLLDKNEVSDELFFKIIDLVQEISPRIFTFETGVLFLPKNRLDYIRDKLSGKMIVNVEIGLESSSDEILLKCINKGITFQDYKKSVLKIKGYGFSVTTNISVGHVFLTIEETTVDAKQSICDCFTAGSDYCVVLPIHIKRYTLTSWLYQNNLYQPITLWDFAKILSEVSDNDAENVQISWYKNFYGENKNKMVASPTTCSKCIEQVILALDKYRNFPSKETIREIDLINCSCRNTSHVHNQIFKLPFDQRITEFNKIIEKELVVCT